MGKRGRAEFEAEMRIRKVAHRADIYGHAQPFTSVGVNTDGSLLERGEGGFETPKLDTAVGFEVAPR